MFVRWLQQQWFEQRRRSPALWLLLPLHAFFVMASTLKRRLTRPQRLSVPVIVVGNITVGGAGKTPLTLWLAEQLQQRGYQPGIVSRGYGGKNVGPCAVTASSDPAIVGDEALLLARRVNRPVWVARDRLAAGRALLAAHPQVNLILCDDGLQHYRLARDFELAVFDRRGAGNGWRLPLGPLREPWSRLATVDAIVCNNFSGHRLPPQVRQFTMNLQAGQFYRLDDPSRHAVASDLAGKKLYALAGIGDPGRFFDTLAQLGLSFSAQAFPDHHTYCADDLLFAKDGILLMTEKDAVKCAGLGSLETWVLPVDAVLAPTLIEYILEKLRDGRQAA
jgi:tetraacyldisaccharide 4'-kinase